MSQEYHVETDPGYFSFVNNAMMSAVHVYYLFVSMFLEVLIQFQPENG